MSRDCKLTSKCAEVTQNDDRNSIAMKTSEDARETSYL